MCWASFKAWFCDEHYCGKSVDLYKKPKASRDVKALVAKLSVLGVTFLSLYFSLIPLVKSEDVTHAQSAFFGGLGVALFFSLVFLVWYELSTSSGKRVYSLSDRPGIKNYMIYWIHNGGRVAIWSRDLSWVDGDVEKLLVEKAKRNELIICLPVKTDLSDRLKNDGAEVYIYGVNYLEDPSARFTIAFYGRDGSKVAVGRTKADKHVIEEFGSGDHPAFYLAHDLVKFAKSAGKGV